MLGKEGLPKVSHKETKMVITIPVGLFKKVAVTLLIAVFGFVMYMQGQNYIARQFCDSLNFTSGFVTLSGVVCEAHVEFPYGKKFNPAKK